LSNVEGVLAKEEAGKLIDVVMNIDKVENIAKIPCLWITRED